MIYFKDTVYNKKIFNITTIIKTTVRYYTVGVHEARKKR